jgi:alkanesulfonate monooxygenase SsuD/methylene tetrahydromethanopterin reductase-like flavin-dependent oxidoreductase (luciferase family)
MRLRLMIEGQEDVTWPQWVALARACEEHGVDGLFRSDHYRGWTRSPGGALDAWTTLAGLAAVTERIRLGTLVSPVTFRPAAVLAKSAVTVDHISGGRVELGIGMGWNEREHAIHGLPFPPPRERARLFAEQVDTIVRHWTEDDEVQPKPIQRPRPPLIVGGGAKAGTLGPAVGHAEEYNTFGVTPEELRVRRSRLDDACAAAGRDPVSIRFTLMTTFVAGDDRATADANLRRVQQLVGRDGDPPASWIVGTTDQVAERLREYAGAGCDGAYLQHLVHEDLETVELIGRGLAPLVANV